MRKCFVFAHYNKDNELKQYVIDEINLLNELGDVLFISDCSYIVNLDRLPSVKYLQVSRHCLYDAHSYLCGFNYLKLSNQLEYYDNITFVNSSISFPKCDKNLFIDSLCFMDNNNEKVYAMCKSGFVLQSYWITCKKAIYKDVDNFFINYIPADTNRVFDWWNKNKDTNVAIKKYLQWYIPRVKEVGEELATKWMYTVINFEEGFSLYLQNLGIRCVALDYGTWKKSRFITKVPRN